MSGEDSRKCGTCLWWKPHGYATPDSGDNEGWCDNNKAVSQYGDLCIDWAPGREDAEEDGYPTEASLLTEADRLLQEIAAAQVELERLQGELSESLKAIQAHWGPLIERAQGLVDHRAGQLMKLAKTHKTELFGDQDSCRVTLPHGVLLYNLTRPVRRVRSLTPETLEAAGFPEAVRIVKSVDWDVLETWPEERLLMVGAERRVKEVYGYEINR